MDPSIQKKIRLDPISRPCPSDPPYPCAQIPDPPVRLVLQKSTRRLPILSLLGLMLILALMGCRRAKAEPPDGEQVAPAGQTRIVTLTPRPAPTIPSPTQPAPPPTSTPPPTATPTPEVQTWQDALALQQDGDYERAIRGLEALLSRQPSEVEARRMRFLLGETYLLNEQPATAAAILADYVSTTPEDARAWFLLGRAWQQIQDWAGVIAAFETYRQLDDTLAEDAGLAIAQAWEALQQFEQARSMYETLARQIQQDTLASQAWAGLARVAGNQKDFRTAAQAALQAADRASDTATKAQLLKLAGSHFLAADQQQEAIRTFQSLVDRYPATGSAYQALRELQALEQAPDLRTQGLVYYYNGAYAAAVEALTTYLITAPAPWGDALYFLGRSHEGLGQWTKAIQSYDQLIENFPNNERYGAAWVRKARAQRQLGYLEEGIATFQAFAQQYPNDPLADNALWEAGRALERLDQRTEAARLYRLIVEQYPHGDVGAGASFRVGILPYLNSEYEQARAAWHLAADRTRNPAVRAQTLLWAGKAALALADSSAAIADFKAAMEAAPLNFDGLRARQLLSEWGALPYELPPATPQSMSAWLKSDEKTLASIATTLRADPRLKRGMALLDVGLRQEGLAELKALRNAHWRRPAHLAQLALLLDDPRTRILSISCLERAMELTSTSPLALPARMAYLAYPADYRHLILAEARRYNLDPRLILALIRQESRFDPTATSYAHARGLTQVIPTTGEYIAGQLGIRYFSATELYRPYRSIQFGVWYLAQQMQSFGDPLLALAAYNGGPGNSRRWQRLTTDPDMLVASIHLEQTKTYVRTVTEQYAIYQLLYDRQLSPRILDS